MAQRVSISTLYQPCMINNIRSEDCNVQFYMGLIVQIRPSLNVMFVGWREEE